MSRKFYSLLENNSFVYLEPLPRELPCGQTQTVQAHYVLKGQVLMTLKELVFYYLVRRRATFTVCR